MASGRFDEADWPTVPGWMWLEQCGGPDGIAVPFLQLTYARGADSVELPLPQTPFLLGLWWASIEAGPEVGSNPGWVPAWVWTEQGNRREFALASLDRTSDVTPRQLPLPTSARGRLTVRKAVARALAQLTGERDSSAAIATLEAVPTDQLIAIEPELIESTVDDGNPAAGTTSDGRLNESDQAWPTVPVWIWLEEDDDETWHAMASLSPTDRVPASAVEAPVSPVSLIRLWDLVVTTLRDLEIGKTLTRTVPVWIWTEEDDGELFAWFSFERVDGIQSSLLDIPHDEQALSILSEGFGAALIWLTDCESPDAAARELRKRTSSTPTRHETSRPRVRRNPKSPKKRAAKRSAERKMVIPRIRIVSGGAPGLGKRR